MQERRPHVLLLPFPSQGHITPMAHLGRRLRAMGVMATMVIFEHDAIRIARANEKRVFPTDQPEAENAEEDNIEIVGVPDGLTAESNRGPLSADLNSAAQHNLMAPVARLIDGLAQGAHPVTCLIGDFFLSWVPELASRTGLPEVILWPQCASAITIHAQMDVIASHGYTPYESAGNENGESNLSLPPLAFINGMPPIPTTFLPFDNPYGKRGYQWVKSFCAHRFSHMHSAMAVICNSTLELEPHVTNILGDKMFFLGPLNALPMPSIPSNGDFNKSLISFSSLFVEDDCMQWLNMQPLASVIYISFGSLAKYSIAEIHQVALGLAASGQSFLWVIRHDMIQESPSSILEALPDGFVQKTQGKGKIITWAPQSIVLAHPSIGGFFSHCGWNSILESLSTGGVPILAWPYMLDQILNSWLISEVWGIGLSLKSRVKRMINKEEVEQAIRLLMQSKDAEKMRSKAKQLHSLLCHAIVKDEGNSFKTLQGFVKKLHGIML